MTIDQAIEHLGAPHVVLVLNSGHAQDAGHPDSLRGRATAAALAERLTASLAYSTLAALSEPQVRSACKSPEQLRAACLEGSCRARGEMVRRGITLPQSALQPAWL